MAEQKHVGILEGMLLRLADAQFKHHKAIIIVILMVTVLLLPGVANIRMEADFSKEMPQDMPYFQLGDKINSKFGKESILILVQLDPSTDIANAPTDIRDPRVIESIVSLQEQLNEEISIDDVQSIALAFVMGVPDTLDEVKSYLEYVPQSEQAFSKDYTTTLMYVSTSVGTTEDKVKKVTRIIQDNIDGVSKPAGVKYRISGAAPISVTILRLLREDAVFTTSIAAFIILIMLFVLQRSITRGFLVFIPLIMGLTWTFGTMGWLDIPLSIATVFLGALILGLGVEYGIFMVSRYDEERGAGSPQLESLRVTVSGIGSAVIGSGATTIAAFLALTLSVMPMIQHLGQTLALGIGCSLFAAVVINPCIILLEENLVKR